MASLTALGLHRQIGTTQNLCQKDASAHITECKGSAARLVCPPTKCTIGNGCSPGTGTASEVRLGG